MSEIDAEVVRHLADLARLDLSDEEVESLVPELSAIVQAVSAVSEAIDGDVEATSHPIPLRNVFRADVHNPAIALSVEEALSGAPDREGDQFKVGPILE